MALITEEFRLADRTSKVSLHQQDQNVYLHIQTTFEYKFTTIEHEKRIFEQFLLMNSRVAYDGKTRDVRTHAEAASIVREVNLSRGVNIIAGNMWIQFMDRVVIFNIFSGMKLTRIENLRDIAKHLAASVQRPL